MHFSGIRLTLSHMSTREAFQAVTRFGLGPGPGELRAATGDPRGWLRAQIRGYEKAERLNLSERALELTRAYFNAKARDKPAVRKQINDLYLEECALRFNYLSKTRYPFMERLNLFWSNHFTVAAKSAQTTALVNRFEAEAIRPHVTGRFADMLRATARHPAMLEYLDNRNSFGPNSFHGRWKHKGLNENLAREIMELHTLGVDGGYSQADVQALAKILTGWSLRLDPYSRELIPVYAFQQAVHEPGKKTLLGHQIKESGETEGLQALDLLANHPATGRHIARKLAVHFISDQPPKHAVDRLAAVFRKTQGDLAAMANTLVSMPETWSHPLSKFKSPYELVLSGTRMLNRVPKPRQLNQWLRQLGYGVFKAQSPAGHPDTAAAWSDPAAMVSRVNWAFSASESLGADEDPEHLAERTIGPVMSQASAFAIENAPTKTDGLALLMASPEFQRR